MCGRLDTSGLAWADIYAQLSKFGIVVTAPINIEPNPDLRPTDPAVVARQTEEGWIIEKMRWGLIPYWRSGKPVKDTEPGRGDGFKISTFNARCEGVASAATFKGAFERRRCIIPATSYYEWTGGTGSKVKHTFRRADGEMIWFGGIWDKATTSDQGEVLSFTVITSPSDGWMAEYHSRAPMILDQGDDWRRWLDANEDAEELMRSVRPERFEIVS